MRYIYCGVLQLLYLRKVLFEIELMRNENGTEDPDDHGDEPLKKDHLQQAMVESNKTQVAPSPEPGTKNVLLKGQMKHINDINVIIFLCSPMYVLANIKVF